MAWARQQYPYSFPIIGGVKIDHLKSNVEVSSWFINASEAEDQSLKITLSSEQLEKLNKAAPFNPGFPAAFFGSDPHYQAEGKPDSALVNVVSRPLGRKYHADVQAGHLRFVNHP
jgi:hypothetical protein